MKQSSLITLVGELKDGFKIEVKMLSKVGEVIFIRTKLKRLIMKLANSVSIPEQDVGVARVSDISILLS